MEYALNENASLVSITGYRDTTEERIYDLDGSNAPFITIERWDESDQFSQELRFDGQWDRFSITAGAYYWNSEYEQDWVTGDSFWSVLFGGVAADPAVWGACQAGALAPVFCDTGIPGGIPCRRHRTSLCPPWHLTPSRRASGRLWQSATCLPALGLPRVRCASLGKTGTSRRP